MEAKTIPSNEMGHGGTWGRSMENVDVFQFHYLLEFLDITKAGKFDIGIVLNYKA